MPKSNKRSKPRAQRSQKQGKRPRTSTTPHPLLISAQEESLQQSHDVLSANSVGTPSSDTVSSPSEVEAMNPQVIYDSQSVANQELMDIILDGKNIHFSSACITKETVNKFVYNCYEYLYDDPDQYADKFYSEDSTFVYENDYVQNDTLSTAATSITTTTTVQPPRFYRPPRGVDQIKNRIRELNLNHRLNKLVGIDYNVLDNTNIAIVVRGEIKNENETMEKFVQALNLTRRSGDQVGHYILNDIFRRYNYECFYNDPELYAPKKFVLTQDIDYDRTSHDIADNAKYLIQKLQSTPKEFAEAYQIEIQENNSHMYEMFLRIDPVKWYQTFKEMNEKLATEYAKKYIEKVRRERLISGLTERLASSAIEQIRQISRTEYLNKQCGVEKHDGFCEKDSESEKNFRDLETNIGIVVGPPPKLYTRHHQTDDQHYMFCEVESMSKSGLCSSRKTDEHYTRNVHFSKKRTVERGINDNWRKRTPLEISLPFQCRKPVETLDRTKRFCLFYADPDYEVYRDQITDPSPDGFPLFFVSSRSQARPIVTLHPIKHATQPEYIQSVDAWKAVLQTLAKIQRDTKSSVYPLQRIFINFGQWMTQKVVDPTLKSDCHAHINIHLKPEIIDACTNKIFPLLVGSKLETKNDRYEDATKHLSPQLNIF